MVINRALSFFHFSNYPEGDFGGFLGFIRRITLIVFMGIDYVLNRHETKYDTLQVVGLTSCALVIFGFFVFIVMQYQKYHTLFCKKSGTQIQNQEDIDEDEDEDENEDEYDDDDDEEEDDDDEQVEHKQHMKQVVKHSEFVKNIPMSEDVGNSSASPFSLRMQDGYLKCTPPKKQDNSELLKHFLDAADVSHCVFNYNKGKEHAGQHIITNNGKCQIGIKKIVTVYGRNQDNQFFDAPEAPGAVPLNTVIYSRPSDVKLRQGDDAEPNNQAQNT